MLDFVEAHSDIQIRDRRGVSRLQARAYPADVLAEAARSTAVPFDLTKLGEWSDRITSFPADFSNVGIDAETRARIHASVDDASGEFCVAGTALIGGLLKGLLDAGVVPLIRSRVQRNSSPSPARSGGVRFECDGENRSPSRASRGDPRRPAASSGTRSLVGAFLRGPMHGAVSPPNNTGDGLRMAMAHGADLANMGEAWWVPIVRIPGDTIDGKPRSRSVRLERTRPRSIIVNRAGKRFVNEAGEYNSMAGAFQYLDPRGGYVNDPAWIVFDSLHLKKLRVSRRRAGRSGPGVVLPVGRFRGTGRPRRASTRMAWRAPWRRGITTSPTTSIPDFGRGSSAYDGYWGDDRPPRRREDARTHRQRAVLRGAGVGGRDGHEGRPAHRPRRSRASRQRRADSRPVRRGQCDGRRDRASVRRSGRNTRSRNGFRVSVGTHGGDGPVGELVRRLSRPIVVGRLVPVHPFRRWQAGCRALQYRQVGSRVASRLRQPFGPQATDEHDNEDPCCDGQPCEEHDGADGRPSHSRQGMQNIASRILRRRDGEELPPARHTL